MARSSKKELTNGAEATRLLILQAAAHEFCQRGLHEARVESIASQAKVNLALLYYYFTNKQHLYKAVIEESARAFIGRGLEMLATPNSSAGDRLLHLALGNFNRHLFRFKHEAVMQRELQRNMEMLKKVALEIGRPLSNRVREVVQEGIEAGELCDLDWMLVVHLLFGTTVSFFRLGPFLSTMSDKDPIDAEFLAFRRESIAHVLGKVLFVDPAHGAQLAEQALIDLPMHAPEKYLEWTSTL